MALQRYDVTYEDADGNTQVATQSTENDTGDWVKASDVADVEANAEAIENLKRAFFVTDTQPFHKMLASVTDSQATALKALFDQNS